MAIYFSFSSSVKNTWGSASLRILFHWIIGAFPIVCFCYCCCSIYNLWSISSFHLKCEKCRYHHDKLQVAIYIFCRFDCPKLPCVLCTWSLLWWVTVHMCIVFYILAVLCRVGSVRMRMRGATSLPFDSIFPTGWPMLAPQLFLTLAVKGNLGGK